jgi:hypothetical protein
MEDIQRFANVRLEPGTLYGATTRLEQRGWIRPYGASAMAGSWTRCLYNQTLVPEIGFVS